MNPRAPSTLFAPVTPALRAQIENAIDDLLALLDAIDGDTDFEDESGDDEPSLGWTYCFDAPVLLEDSVSDDREQEDEHNEDGGDSEPWLGWRHRSDGSPIGPCVQECDDLEREENSVATFY